jgi:hypothetical protein
MHKQKAVLVGWGRSYGVVRYVRHELIDAYLRRRGWLLINDRWPRAMAQIKGRQ